MAALDPAERGRRKRAALGRYSRLVRWMKIVLPLAAVATIGAIFLVGQRLDRATSLLDPEDLAALGAGMQLENPRFSGRTEAGEPYVLRADLAMPDSAMPQEIGLREPRGEIALGDGRTLEGRAASGRMYRAEDRLVLEDKVVLETSDGYRFTTQRLDLGLSERDAESPGPVVAEGPAGSIRAGSMRLLGGPKGEEAARIFFEDGVRVVFIPEASR